MGVVVVIVESGKLLSLATLETAEFLLVLAAIYSCMLVSLIVLNAVGTNATWIILNPVR